jgi:hypothetical protein
MRLRVFRESHGILRDHFYFRDVIGSVIVAVKGGVRAYRFLGRV